MKAKRQSQRSAMQKLPSLKMEFISEVYYLDRPCRACRKRRRMVFSALVSELDFNIIQFLNHQPLTPNPTGNKQQPPPKP